MRTWFGGRRGRWHSLGGFLIAAGLCGRAMAQAPDQSPIGQPLPPLPAATTPPPASVSTMDPDRQQLEDRIRQLESMVQQLSGQIQALKPAAAATPPSPGAAAGAAADAAGADPKLPYGAAGTTGTPGVMNTESAGPPKLNPPGQSIIPYPPSNKRFDSPPVLENIQAKAKFGPGFEIRTTDDEFIFQFHNLTQIDFRGYQQGGQNPVHDTFAIPRQWFMFSGRITQPIGYFVSLAHGFDNVSLLDVFVDFNYSPKLSIRAGRYKTPFTYEFLVEPVQGLLNPERSLFFNNFGQNRDIGIMGYGRLWENRFDYAFGGFNGSRNGVVSSQDGKFVSGLVNFKPFVNDEGSLLENFNIGGSLYSGNHESLPVPQTLRTVVPINGNAVVGVPFLAFNNNVRETGYQAFWDLHAAWFYRSLALIGEWGSGFQNYSLTGTPYNRTALPVQSFYVQAGYLLTGETRSSVNVVKPEHPFDLRSKSFGIGAWEVVTRYDYMDVGKQVFTSGLADGNLWANRLFMTDLGLNWHMTQYTKIYFDWEHAEFNQPVLYAPTKRQLTSDLFWVRLQLYF